MRRRTVNQAAKEPLLDLIHGFPGTGKSRVIAWMRMLMEDGLGWVHGVQFVCLAFQNAMAAQINGFTVHHWSGIPSRTLEGNTTGDRHKQSLKCQALRVLIIDEVSMIAAELCGALDYVVTTAVRVQGDIQEKTRRQHTCFWWRECGHVCRLVAVAPSVRHLPLQQSLVCPCRQSSERFEFVLGRWSG